VASRGEGGARRLVARHRPPAHHHGATGEGRGRTQWRPREGEGYRKAQGGRCGGERSHLANFRGTLGREDNHLWSRRWRAAGDKQPAWRTRRRWRHRTPAASAYSLAGSACVPVSSALRNAWKSATAERQRRDISFSSFRPPSPLKTAGETSGFQYRANALLLLSSKHFAERCCHGNTRRRRQGVRGSRRRPVPPSPPGPPHRVRFPFRPIARGAGFLFVRL
jgi:hypothetical protein